MRNTLPEPPVEERDTTKLIEDLCLALRDVGVRDHGLPDDERSIAAITSVQQLHAELEKRAVDHHSRSMRCLPGTIGRIHTKPNPLGRPSLAPHL